MPLYKKDLELVPVFSTQVLDEQVGMYSSPSKSGGGSSVSVSCTPAGESEYMECFSSANKLRKKEEKEDKRDESRLLDTEDFEIVYDC